MPPTPQRHTAIDWLKAATILTVVWIHAYLTLRRAQVGVVQFLGALSRFAVPAFFFASGFLAHRSERLDADWLRRRLVRVLVPYVVASALAIAVRSIVAGPVGIGVAAWELLTGDAVGIYYFIVPFVLVIVLAVPLSRSASLVLPALISLALAAWLFESGILMIPADNPFDWWFRNQRNPLRWLVYFVLGWYAAAHAEEIGRVGTSRRRWIGLLLLATSAAASATATYAARGGLAQGTLGCLVIYAAIGGVFVLGWDAPRTGSPAEEGVSEARRRPAGFRILPRAVRWLSEATYPIFLYHFFFIYGFRFLLADVLRRQLGWSSLAIDTLAFTMGLAGSCAVVISGRKLLGRNTRLILG